jgi:hypothetical protein
LRIREDPPGPIRYSARAEEKRGEVADFARFLLAQQDDERWEQLIGSSERRPKLEAFLRESAAEGV